MPPLDWYREFMQGEYPVIMCHPNMEKIAILIAKEFSDAHCGIHVSSLVGTESKVILVDPFGKVDPVTFAYVMNRYGPGKTWDPKDAL